MNAWGEGFRDLMKLVTRLADHMEKRREAWREAVKVKAKINASHVERRDLNDPRFKR